MVQSSNWCDDLNSEASGSLINLSVLALPSVHVHSSKSLPKHHIQSLVSLFPSMQTSFMNKVVLFKSNKEHTYNLFFFCLTPVCQLVINKSGLEGRSIDRVVSLPMRVFPNIETCVPILMDEMRSLISSAS